MSTPGNLRRVGVDGIYTFLSELDDPDRESAVIIVTVSDAERTYFDVEAIARQFPEIPVVLIADKASVLVLCERGGGRYEAYDGALRVVGSGGDGDVVLTAGWRGKRVSLSMRRLPSAVNVAKGSIRRRCERGSVAVTAPPLTQRIEFPSAVVAAQPGPPTKPAAQAPVESEPEPHRRSEGGVVHEEVIELVALPAEAAPASAPEPVSAPTATPTGGDDGGPALRGECGCRRGIEELRVDVAALRRDVAELSAKHGTTLGELRALSRRLAQSEPEPQPQVAAAVEQEDEQNDGPVFSDPSKQLEHEIYLAWLTRYPESLREEYPLRGYVFGVDFVESVNDPKFELATRAQIVAACVDVITKRAFRITSREAHAHGEHATTQATRADKAYAYRATIVAKPGAPRLLWWEKVADGSVELARVAHHDDYRIR